MAIVHRRTALQPDLFGYEPLSLRSHRFVVKGVALMFSPLLTRYETGSENSSPNNLAALPYKDGCKNRFYKQIRSAFFFTSRKNLLAAS